MRQISSGSSLCSQCQKQTSLPIHAPVTHAAMSSSRVQHPVPHCQTNNTPPIVSTVVDQGRPAVAINIQPAISLKESIEKESMKTERLLNSDVILKSDTVGQKDKNIQRSEFLNHVIAAPTSTLVKELTKISANSELWAIELLAQDDLQYSKNLNTQQKLQTRQPQHSQPYLSIVPSNSVDEISLEDALAEMGVEDTWVMQLLDDNDKIAVYQKLIEDVTAEEKRLASL